MSLATATVIKSEKSGHVEIQWCKADDRTFCVGVIDTEKDMNREIKVWEFDSVVAEPLSFWWYDYAARTTKQHQSQEDAFLDIPASLMDAEVQDIEVMIRRMMMRI